MFCDITFIFDTPITPKTPKDILPLQLVEKEVVITEKDHFSEKYLRMLTNVIFQSNYSVLKKIINVEKLVLNGVDKIPVFEKLEELVVYCNVYEIPPMPKLKKLYCISLLLEEIHPMDELQILELLKLKNKYLPKFPKLKVLKSSVRFNHIEIQPSIQLRISPHTAQEFTGKNLTVQDIERVLLKNQPKSIREISDYCKIVKKSYPWILTTIGYHNFERMSIYNICEHIIDVLGNIRNRAIWNSLERYQLSKSELRDLTMEINDVLDTIMSRQ